MFSGSGGAYSARRELSRALALLALNVGPSRLKHWPFGLRVLARWPFRPHTQHAHISLHGTAYGLGLALALANYNRCLLWHPVVIAGTNQFVSMIYIILCIRTGVYDTCLCCEVVVFCCEKQVGD